MSGPTRPRALVSLAFLPLFALIGTPQRLAAAERTVVVASKSFVESEILAELAVQLINAHGGSAAHRRALGGTRIVFNALERGDVDVYAEYSGTLKQEILGDLAIPTMDQIHAELNRRGIGMTRPLGFENNYAIGMRESRAEERGITAISDLASHPDLSLRLTNEFMDRGDGWRGLKRHYQLPHPGRGLDHDLAYTALASGDIDAMDVYTTDAEIAAYGLRVLNDDRSFFEPYEAAYLYRLDLNHEAPAAVAALRMIEGRIDEQAMQRLNKRVKIDRVSLSRVAADYLAEEFGVQVEVALETRWDRLRRRTIEHITLVAVAMGFGIITAIPLGIIASRMPRLGQAILGVAGVIQTIPSLAILVFMIPVLGIGAPSAIAALYLYSLLPMVRNTVTGLNGIPPSTRESAEALGLTSWQRLWSVELPLASPSILAGIKTSTVITIGFATLGALIGAGGFGQPILTGIRLDRQSLIFEGAIPSALLAIAAQVGFEFLERLIIPAGLRVRRTGP